VHGLRIGFRSTSDVPWMWEIESSCVACAVRVEVCESGLVAMAADASVYACMRQTQVLTSPPRSREKCPYSRRPWYDELSIL